MEEDTNEVWYYASADRQKLGPFSLGKLRSLAQEGVVTPQTHVWCPDFTDWKPAGEVSGLLSVAEQSAASTVPIQEEEIPDFAPFETISLKPHKVCFLIPRILMVLFLAALLGIISGCITYAAEGSIWIPVATCILAIAIGTKAIFVAYRKERYVLEGSRLICHRGGLFSDQTNEFEIRNITHVKSKLPWLRFKFFGVGSVIVETAGTSKPMVMYTINKPKDVYEEVRSLMKRNGYHLSQRQLLHQEKPALIGILGEIIGFGVAFAFVCLFMLGGLVEIISETDPGALIYVMIGIPLIILPLMIAYIVFRILDFKKRTYSVYNDVVVYEEGFLTQEYAFIPYENIADSNVKASFGSRILGLSDVEISCQGSRKEIKFRHIRNGLALSNAIDQLVVSASQKPKRWSKRSESSEGVVKYTRREEPEIILSDNAFVAECRIHALRLLIPILFLLPLFPVWIGAMLQALIKYTSTRYFVRAGTLRHSYRFINVQEREFSTDKITGLVIKTNLWDMMFGTMTLKFWSIGSGKPLEFAHVHRSQIDLPALLRMIGIPPASPHPYSANATFGFSSWFRANLFILTAIIIIALLISGFAMQYEQTIAMMLLVPALTMAGSFIYWKIYYSMQKLKFHDHHIEAEQGILMKNSYYVRYRNVKRIQTTKYPFGKEGAFKIFVAGEEEVNAHHQQGKNYLTMLKQCSFTTGMIPDVQSTGLCLNDILCGRVDPSPKSEPAEAPGIVIESTRSAATGLLALTLISIIIFPLILLLPISLLVAYFWLKSWRYRVDEIGVTKSWGIIFKKTESVIFDRVDSLQQNQGILNKIFRNGRVSIMTAGSSKPDLVIQDSPHYLGIYQAIRERSQ